MPAVVLTNRGTENLQALDNSVVPMVLRFMEKLTEDDTTPGLMVKPLKNAADRRVRTARVNDDYRAVMMRVEGVQEPTYHLIGVWPHDEGNDRASRLTMTFNPILGVTEVTEAESVVGSDEQAVHEAYQRGLADAALRENRLEDAGWTVQTLVEDAGISQRFAEAALAANNEDALYAVVGRMPEVQQLMLLDLAEGTPLHLAKEKLGLPSRVQVAALQDQDEDAQLAEGARNAPSSFAFIGDTPEAVQRAFEDLTMEQWQIFLHPEQQKYVNHSGRGSFRLTGGAGTGKTVILIHRARHLNRVGPERPILLTTFTRELADSLTQQLKRLDAQVPQVSVGQPGVAVAGIDQVAHRVVSSASAAERQAAQEKVFGVGRNDFLGRIQREDDQWEAAVAAVGPDLDPQLQNPRFLRQEYLSVVLAHRVRSVRDYARVSRTGRGTRLGRRERVQLWNVFEQFRTTNLSQDKVIFAELAVLAAAILEARAEVGEGHLVRHVLADEAQDFHAGHWQLLRALAPAGSDDLFIAEDAHQRIYGQKLVLKKFGIQIQGRSRRLKLNYRTTAENLSFAMTLLAGEQWEPLDENPEDPEELTAGLGYVSLRSGPEPVLRQAADVAGEYDAAADQLRSWQQQGVGAEEIAVLARSAHQQGQVATELSSRGVQVQAVGRGAKPRAQAVGIRTMHNAKGMEFKCVLIFGAGASRLPARWDMDGLPEAERKDALQQERSLLYVAASRARDELAITYSGEPSDLLANSVG